MTSRSEQVAALALRCAMPTTYQYRAFAAAGGLMIINMKTALGITFSLTLLGPADEVIE